jgi:hypothetical protein
MTEEEWQAQETALRSDPLNRLLTDALAHPPLAAIPDGFAIQVARLARPADDERFELLLQYGLLALLVAAGGAVTLSLLTETSLPDMTPAPGTNAAWLSLVLLCLLLSAAPAFLSRR